MIAAWATDEVGSADLGDERLDARFERVLSALGSRPNLSIPAACGGRAEMVAAYRFFDNDKVTFERVLRPHVARTLQRVAEQEVVLLVQDTTEIELTRPAQVVDGAGELDGVRPGVLLHLMQAFTPDGVPLGTAWAGILNRTDGVSRATAAEKRGVNLHTPIEDKESGRWVTGLRHARAVAESRPGVRCVCVADSEADVYELFAEPRGRADWLVRACQDRALAGGAGRPRDRVQATPVRYTARLRVRGRQAKTGAEGRSRRQNRDTRAAAVEVRAATVTLRPPWRFDRRLPEVTAQVVVVREPNPPAGEPPVEWVLVTTLPIDTADQVRSVVAGYCVRWEIEVLFRTLKSGCRVERRRFEQVDRVTSCLGVYRIAAWRTLFVCRMGRECPDLDCEAIFEPSEWEAVWMAVHRTEPPPKAPPLSEMVRLVARLGGYVERPKNAPGAQTVWIGIQRMYDLSLAWETFGPGAKRGRG